MSFEDFIYPTVLADLHLSLREQDLYSHIAPILLDPSFQSRLVLGASVAQATNTEKARSELIIAPVLLELRVMGIPFGLFSGVRLKAEPLTGLSGICDFVLTREPLQSVLTAPLVAIAEAKNDNVRSGLGQCIAEMVAARIVNEQDNITGPVYGIATTGTTWLFSRLDGSVVTLDTREYTLAQIETIMAILKSILEGQPPTSIVDL